MTAPIGVTKRQRGDAADHQDAQDFLGRVGHRRERIRREHREAGDPGQPLVMGEMRRDGRADEQALELREKRLFGHRNPPIADGVS